MYITNPIKNHKFSRRLDIHLTTNHFEIKNLVDVLYNKYFNIRNKEIIKRHLKVLLLNLYIAWNTDPKLEIVVYTVPNSYKLVKRYNQAYTIRTFIEVLTILRNNNLIGLYKSSESYQKVSYIWTAIKMLTFSSSLNIVESVTVASFSIFTLKISPKSCLLFLSLTSRPTGQSQYFGLINLQLLYIGNKNIEHI